MTLILLIELALKSALIAAATLLALIALRNRSAGERSFVAHLGLILTLAVPVASAVLPGLYLAPGLADVQLRIAPLWLYLPPALLLGGVTIIALVRLVGLRHRAAVLVEPAWLGALAHAQRRMGFKSGAALLSSNDVTSPVSWGLFRPTIVLDPRAIAAHGEAEAIIAHELAHVARLDWAKLLVSRIATALFWFNPLVWVLARRCHELREEAADDAVLNHDVDGAGYAEILVRSARHECRGLLLAANGVAPSSGSLRKRVMRVLDARLRRAPAGWGFTTAGLLIALTLGTPLAALKLQAPPVAPVAAVVPAKPVMPEPVALVRSPAAVQPIAPVAKIVSPAQVALPAAAKPAATLPTPAEQRHAALAEANEDKRFSSGDLVAMAVQGVTPRWLNEMAALGYRNLKVDEIISMAVQGVTPEYVRGLAEAGYPHPNVDQLVAMRIHGVTPEFARAATAANGSRPSLDWLLAMRLAGRPYIPKPPRAPKAAKAPVAPAAPAPPRHRDRDDEDDPDPDPTE